jgi:broad specificity phosphatase PhoE
VTTVWLARHGEAHNPHNILYGRLPRTRLSPEGIRQAHELAHFLKLRAQPLSAIYSSPMLRARRTAEIILESQPQLDRVRIDSNLQEVYTSWQGQPMAELESVDWDFYTSPRDPEDESLQTIYVRMQRWLKRVLKRHHGSDVLGVSHGDPILVLVGALTGLPLDPGRIFPRPYIQPGVLYRMQFDAEDRFKNVELFVPHAEAAA